MYLQLRLPPRDGNSRSLDFARQLESSPLPRTTKPLPRWLCIDSAHGSVATSSRLNKRQRDGKRCVSFPRFIRRLIMLARHNIIYEQSQSNTRSFGRPLPVHSTTREIGRMGCKSRCAGSEWVYCAPLRIPMQGLGVCTALKMCWCG